MVWELSLSLEQWEWHIKNKIAWKRGSTNPITKVQRCINFRWFRCEVGKAPNCMLKWCGYFVVERFKLYSRLIYCSQWHLKHLYRCTPDTPWCKSGEINISNVKLLLLIYKSEVKARGIVNLLPTIWHQEIPAEVSCN